MDPQTRENWRKIKDALESAGKTDNWYYRRALAIVAGSSDPLGEPPSIPIANIDRST